LTKRYLEPEASKSLV